MMKKGTRDSRGFTLIAALLLTLLLSALAVGLLYTVNNEQRMGGRDLEGNLAYYGAEAGMENLTSELSQLYQTSPNPTSASITALTNSTNWPTAISGSNITNMNYSESITWPSTQPNGTPCANAPDPCGSWDIVGSGPDQGMVASLIPFNLTVTATRSAYSGGESSNSTGASGASVSLSRQVEVAQLPAFEFGIFCDGDCDYFAGDPFTFGGRVHANGNLFLTAGVGSTLTFSDKVAAAGQIITSQLENGYPANGGVYGGTVYVPAATGACPAGKSGPATNCNALPSGSWSGGFPPSGAAVSNWKGVSTDAPTGSPAGFNSFIINGLTGANKLQLPFVQATPVGAVEIIRKPTPNDTTQVTNARLYNQAQLRILLADTEGDLYPGETRSDTNQDIQLSAGGYTTLTQTVNGVSASNMYYATAKNSASTNDWTSLAPTGCSSSLTSWPLHGEVTVSGNTCQGAWLRVEYLNSANTWVGVTKEWLGYGFGQMYDSPPSHPYSTSTASVPYCKNAIPSNWPTSNGYATTWCQNGISPAILILQQLQESISTASSATSTTAAATQYNWLPINMYDAREGEARDSRPSGDTGIYCSPAGIMNLVQLDVGNLWLWMQGSGPYSSGSGKKINSTSLVNANGLILYFSDHRGMLKDQYPFYTNFYNGFSGMSGLNDTVNSSSSIGLPDNTLEPITYYATATVPYSPEDTGVKGSAYNHGNVDKWGETNLGAGFGLSGAAMAQPYYLQGSTSNAIRCYTGPDGSVTSLGTPTAEWNMVTGPRHALRLVDGGMDASGNSFVPPTNGSVTSYGAGFTVASEEPVYVLGNYNTGTADPFWPSENVTTTPHSAAAIIADAVTLLSNAPTTTTPYGWVDFNSFLNPANKANRGGNTSYYRMAILAGKSIPFPETSYSQANGWNDFGTDGGMHNFLRYLENRGYNGSTVNYAGSQISIYYSQYATGIFKCCNAVYSPPTRNYFFDTQFLNPANLPPGTPEFEDVVSLSYHQNFTPQ